MAEDVIESKGPAPFMAILDEVIGAWRGSVPVAAHAAEGEAATSDDEQVVMASASRRKPKHDPNTRRERLTNALMFLHSRAIPSLFAVYPEADVKVDPKHLVLWLAQAELGLPAKDVSPAHSSPPRWLEVPC